MTSTVHFTILACNFRTCQIVLFASKNLACSQGELLQIWFQFYEKTFENFMIAFWLSWYSMFLALQNNVYFYLWLWNVFYVISFVSLVSLSVFFYLSIYHIVFSCHSVGLCITRIYGDGRQNFERSHFDKKFGIGRIWGFHANWPCTSVCMSIDRTVFWFLWNHSLIGSKSWHKVRAP